jgi:predicted enzyme related to lactoylglutathione lyase
MGVRESHPPGTISWADLATSDLEAAKGFYTELFGWQFEDMPAGEGIVYSMARVDGHYVGAASQMQDQPPHWNVYVTVESADDSAARAKELGATVIAEPFDVFDAGRMAVIQDPTGAFICPWEPRRHIGAELVNAPGALTWADLVTPDVEAAERFYGDWLGWTTEEMPGAEGYRVIKNGDRSNGGMLPIRPDMGPDAPPNWMPYFGVDDLDAARALADDRGGRTLMGPMSVPMGSFAVMADPQGAVFAIWQGTFED